MLGNPRNHSFIPGTPGFFCDGDGVFVGTTSNWAAPRAFDFGIVSTNTSFNNFRFENYTFGYYESAISSNTFNVSTSKDNPNWGGTVALREPIPILEKGKMVTLEYNDWCNNTSNMTTCLPSNSFFVQFKYLVFVPTFY